MAVQAALSSPRFKKAVPLALVALLIVGAAAYGLNAMLSTSPTPAAATPSQSATPTDWLGMQIENVPPGAVVVDTVALGSPAERAGVEPGDVIVAVNGRAVQGTGDIRDAISGLNSGEQVEIQLSRGSVPFTTRAVLTAPPSNHP